MPRIEYLPTPTGDGSVALRGVVVTPGERLRRLLRRLVAPKRT